MTPKRSPAELEFLRRVKISMQSHSHGARVALGKAVGMSPASITDIIAGNQVPRQHKWPLFAKALGFDLSDLHHAALNSENKLTGVTLSVAPYGVDSPSTADLRKQGAMTDGPTATALRAENTRLREQLARLVIQIDLVQDATAALVDLARSTHAPRSVPATRKRKSRTR